MPELTNIEALPVYIISVLVMTVGVLFWENQKLNKEIRDTLREVFPAVTALSSALEFVREGKK
jgi:CHASE3 domain sensor protein